MPTDFLPPDPHANAPHDADRPVFVPPDAPVDGPKHTGDSKRAVAALATGAAGLGLLAFSAGMLFVVTLPASIVGWVLGNRAKQADADSDQANVAVIIGIVGTVFGVIAAIVWIVIVAEPE